MSAKACLLCGKPLGRLRVGGDGEFCSREHRNQPRLRRGMDRLEEANKVTSLMRRRENPRHILAARLMCNSALEQRGSKEEKLLAPETEIAAYTPMLPGPAAPRVNRGPDRYKPPRATRLPGPGVSRRAGPFPLGTGGRRAPPPPAPRPPKPNGGPDRYKPPRATRLPGPGVSRRADPSRLSIGGRGTLPAVPPRRQKLQAKISQAPLVSLRCDTPAPSPVRRDYGMLRRG